MAKSRRISGGRTLVLRNRQASGFMIALEFTKVDYKLLFYSADSKERTKLPLNCATMRNSTRPKSGHGKTWCGFSSESLHSTSWVSWFSRSANPFFPRRWRQKITPGHHLLPGQLLHILCGTFGHTATSHTRFGVFVQALRLFLLRNLAGGQLCQRRENQLGPAPRGFASDRSSCCEFPARSCAAESTCRCAPFVASSREHGRGFTPDRRFPTVAHSPPWPAIA